MKFLKITCLKSKEEMLDIYKNASTVLQKELFDLENAIVDVTMDNAPVVFMIPTPVQEMEFERLYKLIGWWEHVIIEDMTDVAMFGFYKTEDKDVLQAQEEEWQFNKMIEKFVLENSTVDTVLDKISEHGIGSLSEADQKILKG